MLRLVGRVFLFASVLVGLVALLDTRGAAQTASESCDKLYEKFKVERVSVDVVTVKAAIVTANEFLAKCPEYDGQIKDFVTAQIPKLPVKIKAMELKILETRYNNAKQAKDAAEMIASSKELIALNQPYSLDLMLDVATVGYHMGIGSSTGSTFDDEAIAAAKTALEKMAGGMASGNQDKYGLYNSYMTKACPDGKENAVGWMNYIVGYLTYFGKKNSSEAIPFLVKASQSGCETRTLAEPYRLIGVWYVDEMMKLNAKRVDLLSTSSDAETAESKAVLALQIGYAERALDAYLRASRLSSTDSKSTTAYKEALAKKVREVYEFRFDKELADLAALDKEYSAKAFPDPSAKVSPIELPTPTAEAAAKPKPKTPR